MATRLFSVVILLAFLSACGKVPVRRVGSTNNAPAIITNINTIRVLTMSSDMALDPIISSYHAKHPNDRVEKVRILPGSTSGDTRSQIRNKLIRGEVDLISTFDVPYLVESNLVLSLDALIMRDGFGLQTALYEADSLRIGGKLYELPISIRPTVLAYNVDLFRTTTLGLPTKDWTWETLRSAARALTRGEGNSKIWGFSPESPEIPPILWLEQMSEGRTTHFDNETAMREALQFFFTMVFRDQSMPRAPQRGAFSPPSLVMTHDFRFGGSAMTVSSLAQIQSLLQDPTLSFRFDVAPLPRQATNSTTSVATANSYSIASKSSQIEAAWRFLRFAAGLDGAVTVARTGEFPAMTSGSIKQAWFERKPSPPPGTEAMFEQKWMLNRYSIPSSGSSEVEVYRVVHTAINRTLSGSQFWEDAFSAYSTEIQRLRSKTP